MLSDIPKLRPAAYRRLGEAAHPVSPPTDGVFLFGIILGAIACGVTGVVLMANVRFGRSRSCQACFSFSRQTCPSSRLGSRTKALGCSCRSSRLLACAGGRDHCGGLALLGLALIRRGPRGPQNNLLSFIAFVVVLGVMGFGFTAIAPFAISLPEASAL
jgi:hypothetical protein